MNSKKILEFAHNSIVTASQTAYISNDLTTFKLLKNIDVVFLYISKNSNTVNLFNELQILEKYCEIKKMKYGNRFNLKFCNIDSYRNIYIIHLAVIEFFDQILEDALGKYEEDLNFTLQFNISSVNLCTVNLDTVFIKETFICELKII